LVFPLVGGGEADLLEFGLDVGVIDGGALDVGEDEFGFVDAVLCDQPARGFGEPGDGGEEDDDEDELQRQGDAPGDL
jgi:hypothetical protein